MATVRKRSWQSKEGTKTAWLADYTDQEGKRRFATFDTKREAEDWLAETKIEVKRGIHTPASQSITVAEASELWLSQAAIDGLEAATIAQYRQHVKYHIAPLLGRLKLVELAPSSVPEFRNTLIREGRSRVMAKKVVSSLGAILANAIAFGKCSRNVVREQARQHGMRERRLEARHDRRLEVGVDIPPRMSCGRFLRMRKAAGGR
jgi:hypothetical protein